MSTHLARVSFYAKQRHVLTTWDVDQNMPAGPHQVEPLAVDILQVWIAHCRDGPRGNSAHARCCGRGAGRRAGRRRGRWIRRSERRAGRRRGRWIRRRRGGWHHCGTKHCLRTWSPLRVNRLPVPASHQPIDTVVINNGCTCAVVHDSRLSPALLAPQDCRRGTDAVAAPALEAVPHRAAEAEVRVARGPIHALGDRAGPVHLGERPGGTQGLVAGNEAVRCSRGVGGHTVRSCRRRLPLRRRDSAALDRGRPHA
mmetsp:Transcript_102942/g.291598  ORF Transcript_102942/g.291598 Transcript_102942/m.291598 type:complete len:255 (+) Transcript_102942:614-1378(+)